MEQVAGLLEKIYDVLVECKEILEGFDEAFLEFDEDEESDDQIEEE